MKHIIVFLIACLLLNSSDATIRRVGYKGSPLAGVDFSEFQAVYDASAAGDTIQIYGNVSIPVGGTGIAIRKKIIIQGFGYNFDVHPNLHTTSLDAPSRFIGNIIFTFEPGSENSVIEGCAIINEGNNATFIRVAISNITIRNCYISATLENQLRQINNTRIESCVINGLSENSQGFPSINTQIANCILNAGNIIFRKSESTGSITNCVQMPNGFSISFLNLGNAHFLVKNSIFDWPYPELHAPNTTWENCIFRSPQPAILPKGSNNRWGLTYANLFERLGGNSEVPGRFYVDQSCQGCGLLVNPLFNENYYRLKTNSPAIKAGLDSNGDSTDAGIFGGDSVYRYKIGGVPAIPSIFKLSASSPEATSNPYKVIAGVRSNAPANITRVEYYIDTDPGFGKATPLAITPDTALHNLEIPINTERLSPCSHTLYVRARDAAGSWSLVSSYTFQNTYINPAATPKDFMVQFDGVNDYLDLGTWFNQRNFTLSFWVRPDSVQAHGAAIAAIQNDLYLYANPEVKDNYILAHLLQFDMLPNQWNHVTITMDGVTNTRKLYLFGQLIDSNQWEFKPQNGFNLTFGKGGFFPNSYFKGALDEIRLYNQVLSPDSVYLNVSKPIKGNEPGLLGYWNFNNGCETTAPDLTTNNHLATLRNGLAKAQSTVPNIGQQVVPNKGGNTNIVTVKVYDNLFQQGAKAKLTRTGFVDIEADTTIISTDGNIATGIFNLTGKEIGLYNVSVENPDSTEKFYVNSFTIEQGKPQDLWLTFISRNAIRNGRPFTLQLKYGNNGNVDAKGVPLWITFPLDAIITPKFSLVKYIGADSALLDSIPLIFSIDTVINDISIKQKYMVLYFPTIPAGYSGELSFSVVYNNNISSFGVKAEFSKNFYNSPLDPDAIKCLVFQVFPAALGFVPGFDCAKDIFERVYTIGASMFFGQAEFFDAVSPQNFAIGVGKILISCSPIGTPLRYVRHVMNLTKLGKDLQNLGTLASILGDPSCLKTLLTPLFADSVKVPLVNSYDPNEKNGPRKFQKSDMPFNYTILFENISTATAAAQEVLIVDTLDKSKFDISTFGFGNIAFGDTITSTTFKNDKQFTKHIDLRPAKDLIVKTEGRLDTATGIAYWKFMALDPGTMLLTEDPLLGFLPPNVTSPEGEGWVSFNIRPYDTLSSGTLIKNSAAIIFDYNAPIITNLHENIIDKIPPASKVLNLASDQVDSNFVVRWTGGDNLSGVKYYNVYVAVDTGSFTLWKANYSDTIATYNGHPGQQYRFYSIATDSAGNIEANKNSAETTTRVSGIVTSVPNTPAVDYGFKVFPNPTGNGVWFEFVLPTMQQVSITIFDMTGKQIGVIADKRFIPGTHKLYYDLSGLQSGFYIGELVTKQQRQGIKIFKK